MAVSLAWIRCPQYDQIRRHRFLSRRSSASPRKLLPVVHTSNNHGFDPSRVDFSRGVNGTKVDFSHKVIDGGVEFSPEAPETRVDFSSKAATNGVDFSRRAAIAGLVASLVGPIFLVDSAAARRIKPETIEKIKEKLEKMKKASDRRNQESKETPPLLPPTLKDLAGPLVEITL